MNAVHSVALLIAVVGCGMVAGVFFAFSSFVMPALRQVRPGQGMVAMQSINVSAVTPAFMSLLFGTAAVCLVLVVLEVAAFAGGSSRLVPGASALYLLGVIGVTIVRNVPLNNELAGLEPESPDGSAFWANYLNDWTAWNHLRAVAALLAAGMFMLALHA
jgi:uncharacterized membrane protein